jgi:hypothetical protein
MTVTAETFQSGDVNAFVDDGVIMLRSVDGEDPKELTEDAAENLGRWLLDRAREIRSAETQGTGQLIPVRRTVGNQNFTQTMTFRHDDENVIIDFARAWDKQQAEADIMGYMGGRVLADRSEPGRYVIVADFGVVNPGVSAAEEAARNNERPETQASGERLRAAVGEIEFRDYDEIYRTEMYGL